MREFATRFYKSKKWNDTREAYLSSVNYLCENCLSKGIYKPAEIVHHIEHVEPWNIDNPEITLAWDNLKAVCRECHAKEHDDYYKGKSRKRRFKVSESGEIKIFDDAPL